MKKLIQSLVEAVGPSGYEDEVRNLVRAEIEEHVDSIQVDALGNLIARKGKKGKGGKRVMLSAHIDEIGVIVTHVDDEGFARFAPIGGVRSFYCLGGRVRFVNGVRGVISAEGNLFKTRTAAVPLDKLFIDVGATSRENCPLRTGDIAAFDRPFLDLGNRLVSKAMDDRLATAILIEVIRKVKSSPHELVFVFSVQEEVGQRGAITSAYGIDPDIGISVDVTLTGDTPKSAKMNVKLGKGPAVKVRDGGMLSDPRLVQHMVDTAEKLGLPYQMEVLVGGTTDARAIQITRAGVPSGCVSIPCRYVHSPSEMVDFGDVENTIRLVVELVSSPINLE